MLKHGETLAVAESVTSGALQCALSLADQAMNFFQGGITAYNLGQKARHLKIDPIHAVACNCISERVATEMAANVCNLYSSQWGIGITGYATKVPEEGVTTLFAYYSLAYRGEPLHGAKLFAKDAPAAEVQQWYVHSVLEDFADFLKLRK